MFSNLKTTKEFRELKKKYKEKDAFFGSFKRESLSIEFEALLLLLESVLNTKIADLTLSLVRDKTKGDRYGITFKIEKNIDISILENIFVEKDYKIINNNFTFFLE